MNLWVEAARPRTLSAAVVPVLVGTATAGEVVWWRFGAALVVSLALQVAVNYANDYFDGVRGVDTPDRVGPRRAVAAGLVAPSSMKAAIGVALATAGVAGIALTIAVGPELLLVGVASIAAALAYSGGPRPYASAGLGEVFVFVFFGLVATVGSTYVHLEEVTGLALAAAVPVGFLATALLVVNNLRDIPTDRDAGKRTLAVRMGERGTRRLFAGLIAGAALASIPLGVLADRGPIALLGAVPFAAAPRIVSAVYRERGAALVPCLADTARLLLGFAAVWSVILWIS